LALLQIENLSWRYEGSTQWALENINLEVNKGDFVTIMGQTGAGKSTLCKCINSLIPRRSRGSMKGIVKIAGLNTRRANFYKITDIVGIVFQDPETQFLMMTVEDEIALGLENKGFSPKDIRTKITDVMEKIGLDDAYISKTPTELSGGEKQKVAIAMMLALDPELILLDEPTSDLDPVGKTTIFKVIEKLRKEKETTIILVSHESERVAKFSNKVIILDKGKITLQGDTKEIFKKVEGLKQYGVRPPQVSEIFYKLGYKEIPLTLNEGFIQIKKDFREIKEIKYKIPEFEKLKKIYKEPIIEVENLSYIYPDGTEALKGIDLKINDGDFIAIIGPNGSGKTTLVKHFNGLLMPTQGKVIVSKLNTLKVSINDLARHIGYCFQNPDHQLFCSTVTEEIAFGLNNLRLPANEIEERVDNVLKIVGLEEYEDMHPFFLGKGLRQRLAVAAVIAMESEIIVVDEPTTGQDYEMCKEIMILLDKLNKMGKTIIIITHDMKLVSEYCRRAIVMVDGKIIADDDPKNIFSDSDIMKSAQIEPPQIVKFSLLLSPSTTPALTVQEMKNVLA
jgi:energy-coupling factor transport system ATP-binding protein